MKRRNLLIILLFTFLLFACSKEEEEEEFTKFAPAEIDPGNASGSAYAFLNGDSVQFEDHKQVEHVFFNQLKVELWQDDIKITFRFPVDADSSNYVMDLAMENRWGRLSGRGFPNSQVFFIRENDTSKNIIRGNFSFAGTIRGEVFRFENGKFDLTYPD